MLHNVIRTLNYLHELDARPLPTITYKAKVKLHGTNCGIQITTRGGVFAQSRTGMLTLPSGDYKGFAKWVAAHKDYWKGLKCPEDMTIFGEWCGPGVEKGMAISKAGGKVFAVFAVQYNRGDKAFIVTDPLRIAALFPPGGPTNLHVLPWWKPEPSGSYSGDVLKLNFADEEGLKASAVEINEVIRSIEAEDPWVKATFGIKGMGEGLVFYPVGDDIPVDPEGLALLMFKAKGEKHRTAGHKEAVQVAPEIVESIDGFVSLMVTDARLEQGLTEACGGEAHMRHTRNFLAWVEADVEKESVAELEVSGLAWTQVQKEVQGAAREWLKAKALG